MKEGRAVAEGRWAAATAAAMMLAGCDGSGERRETGSAPAAAAPAAPLLAKIPARFRGRWGLGANDCDPAMADVARGLMVVEPERLVFYESRGLPSRIAAEGADGLRLSIDYSGEGQSWTHEARLTLSDDDRALTRDEKGADTGVLTYRRCPATTGKP